MDDDPITTLERELVDAARRRTAGRPGVRRGKFGGLGPAAAVALTLLIGAGALILLGAHKRAPSTTTPSTTAVPGREQLIDIISVLRRPQTKADREAPILSRALMGGILARGTPDVPLVRYATTTPWGEKLYFVPMKPPTAKPLAQLHLPAGVISRLRTRGETLGVFSARGGGGGGTAADIEAGYGWQTEGAGRSFAGGSTETRIILVVPDGVAKVAFVLPRQSSPGQPGAPIYRHALTVTVPVHDNVAAVQVDRQCCQGRAPMIWYAADGHVVRRVGNPAAANRVIPAPAPGPETAQSRAAERDPSTPNRVWVTPSVGGPHTDFKVHFRVLLNDADYSYRLSGTSCPAITLNGGDGGGTNDLRGRIWSDFVDAAAGQAWCPGTYHLSVTIMDLGRSGQLKHPAKPFGSATFTVR